MSARPQSLTVGSDPQLARDAEELRQALVDLVRLCQARDRGTICCYDVSVTQCHAIDVLSRSGPLTLNALARELYLDKTTASRVVSTLVRKRYVSRRASPEDGRSILLRVTAKGRRLHESIRRDLNAQAAALLAETSPEVRAANLLLLRRLYQAVAGCCGKEGTISCSSTTGAVAHNPDGDPRRKS